MIPMAMSQQNLQPLQKIWWKANVDLLLPSGPTYKYKYVETHENGFFSLYKYSVTRPESHERTFILDSMEDVFADNSLEKAFIGHVLYEVERCSSVNEENLEEFLSDCHARELHALKGNLGNKNILADVQGHIIKLFESENNSDAQRVFLARLLGNCSMKGAMPSLENNAKNILRAFQRCRVIIRPFLEKTENKDTSSDLQNIVISSLKALQANWMHVVFYTYPAISAKKLCTLHRSWDNSTRKPDTKLDPISPEEVLSVCYENFNSTDDEKLLAIVFLSITDVKALLEIVKQHGQSSVFQDSEHGYKSWVKEAFEKQIRTMAEENIPGLWKMVADETDILTLQLLTKELVLESLAHSIKWSKDATKFISSLLSDDSFWQTPADEKLSISFLNILNNMLDQSNWQTGIDSLMGVISQQWVTKWVSLDNLEKLVGDGFTKQLQTKMQPTEVIQKIYIFLGTVHSTTWLHELPILVASLDRLTLKFIQENNLLSTLLEMAFMSNSKSTNRTLSEVGLECVERHTIWTILHTNMTPSTACKVLTPYAPNGRIDVHSR